ncbi:MAG: hypothetical protein BWK78_00250 [Thiotrichaceae bacterium IS1]|nr:MAG: hypothetical protein BWK78_00250 [Thiotrichaceae bacterium IS1]
MLKNSPVSKAISFLQLLLILAFMPLLLGQSDCQINQNLLTTLQNLITGKLSPSAPGQSEVYITHLSFIDDNTKSMMAQTEESDLINKAVVDGIGRASKANSSLKLNASGHEIKNTDANVNNLINIIANPNVTPAEKMGKITKDMMEPNKVDVIVTGSYVDKGEDVVVKPIVIVRKDQKSTAKTLTFKKPQYICPDPVNPQKKALCSNAHEDIAKAVKDLLESL